MNLTARERIKIARLLAGLTLDELASRLGVHRVNPVRWESSKDIPHKQVTPFSAATGMPEMWIKGENLEGIVVSRPFLPTARPAKNVQERIIVQLLEALPRVCKECDEVVVRSGAGSAFIFSSKTQRGFCLVLFASGKLELRLLKPETREVSIDEVSWTDAFEQPKNQHLRTIIQAAGLNAWAEKVPIGEPGDESTRFSVRLDIVTPNSDAELYALSELAKLVKTLRDKACTANYSIIRS